MLYNLNQHIANEVKAIEFMQMNLVVVQQKSTTFQINCSNFQKSIIIGTHWHSIQL